ncbi:MULTISPECIES: BsuBI/PstI family type II restriction endonuclease [Collinsella]|uniref:BsuBI/PstI family type II restriction endonuclease n=1 Tax=Collinsella TaxID=102106 RepID=UPI000833DA5C|nr:MULTISPECIES: BsuBI/PstI family type II restriction endonuclease [Collinsella]OUO58698.1 hypothetical protein B5F74_09750 [Collinsella sp. An271]
MFARGVDHSEGGSSQLPRHLTPSQMAKLAAPMFSGVESKRHYAVYWLRRGRPHDAIDAAMFGFVRVKLPSRDKGSDFIVWREGEGQLYLMEACPSYGLVDLTSKHGLVNLFGCCGFDLIHQPHFPNRRATHNCFGDFAWETETWCADALSHMFLFDGEYYMGSY